MIQIPRKLLHQVRTVLRAAVFGRFDAQTPIHASADKDGLRLRAMLPEVALEYCRPGEFGAGAVCFRADLLKKCEGSRDDMVSLAAISEKEGVAEWTDGGIPQSLQFEIPKDESTFPEVEATLHKAAPAVAEAIRMALPCCGEGPRFATQCLMLDGAKERVVSTDGKQLLIINNVSFPWKQEVLIPALAVLNSKEVMAEEVQFGKTDKHITLVSAPWRLNFFVDKNRRYPRVDQIVPKPAEMKTTVTLDAAEARFLAGTLGRLPGIEEEAARVTLDAGEEVVLRVKSGQDQTTEVLLSHSRLEGKPIRVCLARELFARALQLGFDRFSFVDAETPMLCQTEGKTYLAVPFPAKSAVPPAPTAAGSWRPSRHRRPPLPRPDASPPWRLAALPKATPTAPATAA
jgi:hypothetical protein